MIQKTLIICFFTFFSFSVFADDGIQLNSYFQWARGSDGWGYCYEWTLDGYVLNQGRPVNNSFCEKEHKSHYEWARATNGYTYCYQFTPQKYVLNRGRPVNNHYCRY